MIYTNGSAIEKFQSTAVLIAGSIRHRYDMEFDKLKIFLMEAEFSDKQFREIRAIADIRLGNFSAREANLKDLEGDGPTLWAELFYKRLRNYLHTQCKISTTPLAVLKTTSVKQYKAVLSMSDFLYSVATDWNTDKKMQRNFVVGVYHLYCELTVQYLQKCGVPVSLKSVLQHADKFVGLVDASFPGYVAAGTIRIVILGADKND